MYKTIEDKVESALRHVLGDCFYAQTPDFSYTPEPDRYAVYSMNEFPAFWGDGKPATVEFTVTVNVFTANADTALYNEIINAFQNNGLSWISGGQIFENTFPSVCQHYLDFKGVTQFG